MESILRSIITSPGVIGGMITDESGKVIIRVMPDMYDNEQLARVGNLLLEQQFGLEDVTGGVRQSEIRFELGKLVVRAAGQRSLVLLCEPAASLQVVSIALNVASKKLEKMVVTHPAPVMEVATAAPAGQSNVRRDDDIPAIYRAAGFRRAS